MVEPNRFSGLADRKPRTPRGVSSQGSTWGHLGYFVSGFMVLEFPLVAFRQIFERKFQKCEAQPAFPLGSIGRPREISWLCFMVLGLGLLFFFKSSTGSFKSVEPTARNR